MHSYICINKYIYGESMLAWRRTIFAPSGMLTPILVRHFASLFLSKTEVEHRMAFSNKKRIYRTKYACCTIFRRARNNCGDEDNLLVTCYTGKCRKQGKRRSPTWGRSFCRATTMRSTHTIVLEGLIRGLDLQENKNTSIQSQFLVSLFVLGYKRVFALEPKYV